MKKLLRIQLFTRSKVESLRNFGRWNEFGTACPGLLCLYLLNNASLWAIDLAKSRRRTEQDRQLALLVEEERQASENLFGITWDFSKGPPQGEQRDQALAGIQWMYGELKKKLPTYMTAAQRAVWEKYEVAEAAGSPGIETSEYRPAPKGKIQLRSPNRLCIRDRELDRCPGRLRHL
jgi:hypothetical protein